MLPKTSNRERAKTTSRVDQNSEAGFSILETAIALVLMTIVALGAASLFYYSIGNTVTAGDRDLSMAVAQQKMEQLRNVDFLDAALTATVAMASLVASIATSSGLSWSAFTASPRSAPRLVNRAHLARIEIWRRVAHDEPDAQLGGMIRKLKSGEFRLYSRKRDPRKRRNLGTFRTLAAAKRHERAVQFFKRH